MTENVLDKDALNKEWDKFSKDFHEFSQGPSDFQIEVFMGRGEGPPELLPEHAYRHMLAQIKPAISELRRLKIEAVRLSRKKERMEADALKWAADPTLEDAEKYQDLDIDLSLIDIEIEENVIAIKGKEAQYKVMEGMLDHLKELHGEMTNENLQKREPTYWLVRLARQMIDAFDGNMTGVGSGNINSVRNAVQGSFVPGSKNRIPLMELNPDLMKELANGSPQAIQYVMSKDVEFKKELHSINATPPALVIPRQPTPEEKKGEEETG